MIRKLIFENAGPFKGHHSIVFGPGIFSITAEREDDQEHSNWAGKSFFLEMINFTITGLLNKHRKFDVDGWITRGETKGRTKLYFEDRSWIEREKVIGKSLQTRFSKLGQPHASQAEAESQILEYISLNESDFKTISYFEQGEMARIIRGKQSERFEAIRGWFGLELAEKAEKRAKELAAARVKTIQRTKAKKETLVGLLESYKEDIDVSAHEKLVKRVDTLLEKTMEEYKKVREVFQHKEVLVQYRELKKEGLELVKQVEVFPNSVTLDGQVEKKRERYEELLKKKSRAEILLKSRKKVSLGQFSGDCPVAPITCPVKDKINEEREETLQAFKNAKEVHEKIEEEFQKARSEYEDAKHKQRDLEQNLTRLEALRDEAKRLIPKREAAKKAIKEAEKFRDVEELSTELSNLRTSRDRSLNLLSARKINIIQRAKIEAEIKSVTEYIELDTKVASDLMQTRSIFRASQRRISERGLNRIGHDANQMLTKVDLSIKIQWEYEGKTLASSCEMCGSAFPASTKVRICEECGAERGLNVIQSLDFIMSDSSGAADSFGGIAMQLSAGSWLLAHRESPWSVAMIDEPFEKMDPPVRRIAAKQLLELLGQSAYRQIFVISHSQETVDMYPKRIRIIVDREGNRRIVQE